MKIKELKQILKMFDDETEIFIRTQASDIVQPINNNLISLVPSRQYDHSGTTMMDKEKLMFTAFIPQQNS